MNGEEAEEHAHHEFNRFSLPSILRLKDEHVEPGHEELVKLTLSTGSTYPSPPQKLQLPPPPESPPHPSLLQLFPPPSSSSTRSREPPLPQPSFSQLMYQFTSRSAPEPSRSLVLPPSQPQWRQNSIFTLPPPPPAPDASTLHPSLLMPSLSSPPLPGFNFSIPSSSSHQPPKQNSLTLRPPELHCTSSSQPMLPEQMTAPQPPADQSREDQTHRRSGHRRKRNSKKEGWQPTIEPPYPWASSTRAKILSMEELISKKITVITGDIKCKECQKQFQIAYDLESKFSEVVSFIARGKGKMHDRAPEVWMKPEELDCNFCGKSKCVEPVPPEKKKKTNWLFLFLGQMIGSLNLDHLKYFCKYASCHRTAAKDRLVYCTYKNLHCQLDPKAEDLYNPMEEDDL